MKRYLILLTIILIFASSGYAWFYPNEPFRIPITITSPSTLTNYPILIDLNSAVLLGDNNSHFWLNTMTSGKDIRFSNKDDNQSLDFYREFFNQGSGAHFWVEIKNLAVGDQNIFMYYGDSNASEASSIPNTFQDDGNGTTISGWSLVTPSGSPWFSNGTQYQNDSITGTQTMSKGKTISNALAYAGSVQMGCGASNDCEVRYYLFDAPNTTATFLEYNSAANVMRLYSSGDSSTTCSIAITDGQIYDVNFARDYAGTWRMYANGSSCSVQNTEDLSGTAHGFSHAGSNGTTTGYGDAIYLKNTNAGGEPGYRALDYQDNGNATFRIVDEETTTGLDATLLVNGVSVDVNSAGFFDINFSTVTFPITLQFSLTGYDSRTFIFGTSTGMLSNSIMGLRTEAEAKDISFTFFAPDEITTLPDTYIGVRRAGVLSGFGQTNDEAGISFNLAPQDQTYLFDIYSSSSDTNLLYTYTAVTVTVNVPKNESTNTNITPNSFDLDIGGLGLQSYTAQALPISTIYILGNTQDVYTLRIVDNNSNGQQFSARNYIMQAVGDVSAITINPYLIDLDDVVLVKIVVKDLSVGNPTIPNIRLTLRAGISGTNTIVEDILSNVAGEAKFSFLSQRQYTIQATSPNQAILYPPTVTPQPISDTSDIFYLFIDFNGTNTVITGKVPDINYSPSVDVLTGTSENIDVNVSYPDTFNLILIELLDQNVVEYSDSCTTSPCNKTFNATLSNFDTNTLNVHVQIQLDSGNLDYYRNYFILGFQNDFLNTMRNVRNTVGPIGLLFLWFISILGVYKLVGDNDLQNNNSRIYAIVTVTGLYMFVWWFDSPAMVLLFMGAIFGTVGFYLWKSNRQA